MNKARLRQVVSQILREEIGRNYHTVDPTPNTWDTFEDFEIEYYPQDTGEYLMDISFKGKKLIPTTRFGSYADAENYARRVVDKCRVEWMNSVQAKNESIELLGQLIKEVLLQERVFGAQAFVYHGSNSRPDLLIPALLNDQYRAGGGDLYGKGLYAVYKLDDTSTGAGGYGQYIYKLKINLSGFIIFDLNIAAKVYGKPLTPSQQAERLGLHEQIIQKLLEIPQDDNKHKYTSSSAYEASKFLRNDVKGILFSGEHDGPVVVIYDPAVVVPVAWKDAKDTKWNQIDRKALKPALRRSATDEWEKSRWNSSVQRLKRLENLPISQRVFKGDLELRETFIASLPAGLKVLGALDLRRSPITSLPSGLSVEGDLDLRDSKITALPDGLHVGGYLDLRFTSITSLPDGLSVGGDLHLDGSHITSLPSGLRIGGSLVLGDAPITSLPDGLHVGDTLNIKFSSISSLPKDLQVGRMIYFRGDESAVPPHLRGKLL